MFKIIISIVFASALPLFAQTSTPDVESTTTVTKTTTSEQPVATPTPMTTTTTTKTVEITEPATSKSAEGVLAEINLGAGFFTVIVPDSSIPMKFMFDDTTTMVDLQNESVKWEGAKLGQAVTITYTAGPDQLMATNVAFGDPDKLVPLQTTSSAVSITTGVQPAVVAPTPALTTEETTTTTTVPD